MIQTTTRDSERFPKPYGFCYLWSEAAKGTEAVAVLGNRRSCAGNSALSRTGTFWLRQKGK